MSATFKHFQAVVAFLDKERAAERLEEADYKAKRAQAIEKMLEAPPATSVSKDSVGDLLHQDRAEKLFPHKVTENQQKVMRDDMVASYGRSDEDHTAAFDKLHESYLDLAKNNQLSPLQVAVITQLLYTRMRGENESGPYEYLDYQRAVYNLAYMMLQSTTCADFYEMHNWMLFSQFEAVDQNRYGPAMLTLQRPLFSPRHHMALNRRVFLEEAHLTGGAAPEQERRRDGLYNEYWGGDDAPVDLLPVVDQDGNASPFKVDAEYLRQFVGFVNTRFGHVQEWSGTVNSRLNALEAAHTQTAQRVERALQLQQHRGPSQRRSRAAIDIGTLKTVMALTNRKRMVGGEPRDFTGFFEPFRLPMAEEEDEVANVFSDKKKSQQPTNALGKSNGPRS